MKTVKDKINTIDLVALKYNLPPDIRRLLRNIVLLDEYNSYQILHIDNEYLALQLYLLKYRIVKDDFKVTDVIMKSKRSGKLVEQSLVYLRSDVAIAIGMKKGTILWPNNSEPVLTKRYLFDILKMHKFSKSITKGSPIYNILEAYKPLVEVGLGSKLNLDGWISFTYSDLSIFVNTFILPIKSKDINTIPVYTPDIGIVLSKLNADLNHRNKSSSRV